MNRGLVGHQCRRNNGANDMLDDLLSDEGLLGFFRAMLCDHVLVLDSDNDVVSVHGLAIGTVHQGDLGFGVGASPWQGAVKTKFADLSGQGLGESDGQGHPATLVLGVAFGLVAGIAEHQTLVARALVVDRLHHTAVDVSGLAGDQFGHFAQVLGGGVHANAVGGVANGGSGLASDSDVVWSINASSEFDLTGQHNVRPVFTTFHEGLNGDLCLGVKGKARIDDCVGNRIAQFVRMACCYRFRSEQPRLCHGPPSSHLYIKNCRINNPPFEAWPRKRRATCQY